MIQVKKLGGTDLWINPHQVESMELTPDLTVTMLSGRKIMLAEQPQDVIDKIVDYRNRIAFCRQEI